MIIGPIIGFSLIKIFNLSGFAAGVLLIQSSMPSAVLNYLVASIYSPKKIVDNCEHNSSFYFNVVYYRSYYCIYCY